MARESPQADGEYGRAAAASGDFELADRIWQRFRRRESKSVKVLAFLAAEYSALAMYAQSRALWMEAAGIEPKNLDLQLQLAWYLARSNSVADARPVVERCRALNSQNELARFLSAYLDSREEKFAEAEAQFEALIGSSPKTPLVCYGCHAELARLFDRTGRFDEAMAQLETGKTFARQTLVPTSQQTAFFERFENEARQAIALPKNILETWGKSFPPDARTALTSTHAFLSGTARSGTTLMERVLDAHPTVAACDEPLAFDKVRWRIDALASALAPQTLNTARQLYAKNLATTLEAPVAGKMVLDKNPSRVVWLPQLLRTLPELRVLTALRDPRDVIVSIYFQDHPNTNYLTFEELARRSALLMDAWLAIREWEGLNWMETRYEDFVANLENEGRRVTKFLGLEWHENQARFHEHNREKPIMSNNNADVTRPVYKRAVGRWRVYEKQLAPILPVLEPYCRKFGYE